MKSHTSCRITRAKQKLAAGILIQARRDLRRFHGARTKAQRELYFDALNWIKADSYRWSFSFLNVCRILDLEAEEVRRDLLHEVALGALPYWSRRAGRILRQFHLTLRRTIAQSGPRLALT